MKLIDMAKDLIKDRRLDSWFNVVTGLGGVRDRSSYTRAGDIVALNVLELESLHASNGLAGRIVDLVPNDAIGTGIKTKDEALDKELSRLNAWDQFATAWKWGRLYGAGALYLGMSDRCGPQDRPLADGAIGRGDLLYLLPIDGIDLQIAEHDYARGSMTYGEPSHYSIGRGGGSRIHASRFIFFGGALTPYRRRRAMGRDYSVLQRVYDSLKSEGAMNASVRGAFDDLSQAVFAIKDLTTMIANGQADVVRDRMEIANLARSIAKSVVIDADMERFEHVGAANLTGVDPLLGRGLQRVASDAEIPATILLGISPVGLNATGESDLKIWDKRIGKERQGVESRVVRLASVVSRSAGIAIEVDPEDLEWPPLDVPTAKEKAEREQIEANTDAIRISSGVLAAPEVALVRWGGVSLEDLVTGRSEAADDEAEAETLRPNPGETWIDTSDQHRLQVTTVANDRVYFVDLDSENPSQQWAWREATFVERSRRLEAGPAT